MSKWDTCDYGSSCDCCDRAATEIQRLDRIIETQEEPDVRRLFDLGVKWLPIDVAADLKLASTTNAWFCRLRNLIEKDRAVIETQENDSEMNERTRYEDIHSARYHDAGTVAKRAMEIIQRLEEETDFLRILLQDAAERESSLHIQNEALGDQICNFNDTNPLNEVVELEKERESIEEQLL